MQNSTYDDAETIRSTHDDAESSSNFLETVSNGQEVNDIAKVTHMNLSELLKQVCDEEGESGNTDEESDEEDITLETCVQKLTVIRASQEKVMSDVHSLMARCFRQQKKDSGYYKFGDKKVKADVIDAIVAKHGNNCTVFPRICEKVMGVEYCGTRALRTKKNQCLFDRPILAAIKAFCCSTSKSFLTFKNMSRAYSNYSSKFWSKGRKMEG